MYNCKTRASTPGNSSMISRQSQKRSCKKSWPVDGHYLLSVNTPYVHDPSDPDMWHDLTNESEGETSNQSYPALRGILEESFFMADLITLAHLQQGCLIAQYPCLWSYIPRISRMKYSNTFAWAVSIRHLWGCVQDRWLRSVWSTRTVEVKFSTWVIECQ